MAGGLSVTGDAREERDVVRERGKEGIRDSRVGPLFGVGDAVLGHVSFTAERLGALRYAIKIWHPWRTGSESPRQANEAFQSTKFPVSAC